METIKEIAIWLEKETMNAVESSDCSRMKKLVITSQLLNEFADEQNDKQDKINSDDLD